MKDTINEFNGGSSAKQGGWSIFKITNHVPNQKKEKKSYYFVTSQYDDEESVRSRVRAMIKSRTVRGGIKQIAKDMRKDSDYDRHFSVKRLAKGLSKERAMEMRQSLKSKKGKKMIYNKPRM
jgi:hypothetical protein